MELVYVRQPIRDSCMELVYVRQPIRDSCMCCCLVESHIEINIEFINMIETMKEMSLTLFLQFFKLMYTFSLLTKEIHVLQ